VKLQSGEIDRPDRIFSDLSISLSGALQDDGDFRELIPEFFFQPEMFMNGTPPIKFGTT
jgi:hypothetical protein